MRRLLVLLVMLTAGASASKAQTWTWLQDEPMLVNAAGGPCQPPVTTCNIPVGQFAPTTAGSIWVIAVQTTNNVTISNVTGGGGTWVHCPNCHAVNPSGFSADAWYNLTGIAGTNQNIAVTLSSSSGAVFGETFYEILPPAGFTASYDTSGVATGTACQTCATPSLTLTATDAVIINPGGASSHGFDSYSAPYFVDWNGAGIGLNINSNTPPTKTFRNASNNPEFFAIAFKSTAGSFTPPTARYSVTNLTESAANCTNCTVPGNTGTGHLLFLQSASQNGAFIQSVSGGGSGWVVPAGANSCKIAGAITGVSSASSSCAYLLSSTAGASSISVTMSGGGQVNLGLWEIASASGAAFTVDTQNSFYISTTSAFYDNGPALTLTGDKDVVFQSAWIQGGSLGPTFYPQTNIPSGVISGVGGGNYLMLNQFSISSLLEVPSGSAPVPVWINPQHDNIFVSGIAFNSASQSITAADCTTASVQTAINTVVQAGTVIIPACPAGVSWTSGVTVSKGIKIQGQGAGRPFAYSQTTEALTVGAKALTINPTNVTQAASQLVLTPGTALIIQELGFRANIMQGTVTSYTPGSGFLQVNITSAAGICGTAGPANTMDSNCARWMISAVPQTVLINNNAVQGGTGGAALFALTEDASFNMDVSGFKIANGTGIANGINVLCGGGKAIVVHDIVWEQNGFDGIYTNCNRGLVYNFAFSASPWSNTGVGFHQKFAPTTSWSTASLFGSADTTGTGNFYIETSACYAYLNCTDMDDYGRSVWRYNLMWDSGYGTHGADTSNIGVRTFEYYNNVGIFESGSTSATANMNWWLFVRGGTSAIHDNTLPAINSGFWGPKLSVNMTVMNLQRNSGPNPCWGAGTSGGAQYYAPREPGIGFVTGVGHDGLGRTTDSTGTYVGDSEPIYIWNNSSVPLLGVGTSNFGGTACTSPDSSSNYIVSGRDYFNGSTVKPGYTPFTYPHPLTGSPAGATPVVSLSPSPVAFGNVTQGTSSSPVTVTVTNSGTATLTLSAPFFTISGANAGDFAQSGGTCVNGGSVAAGANCTLLLTFNPTGVGSESATLAINGNAAGTVSLTGTSVQTSISVVPSGVSLGNVLFRSSLAITQNIVITNTGSLTVTLTSEIVGGANPADFPITGNTCSSTLAIGASCTVTLTIKPLALGARAGTLTISDNATGNPHIVPLSMTSYGNISGVGSISGSGSIIVQP